MCKRPRRWERVLRALLGIDYNLERIEARMGAFEDKVELLASKVDLLIARGAGSGITQDELDTAEARATAAEAAAAQVVADDASEDAAQDQARADQLDALIAKADAALTPPVAEEPPVEEAPVEEAPVDEV